MPLNVPTFNTLVTNMSISLTSATKKVTNLTSGSVALALLQSVAGNAVSLLQLLVHVYNTTRLATSAASDVDTFINDFGMTRIPATPSTTGVVISRSNVGVTQTVDLTGILQTKSGTQFIPIADPNQAAFDPVQGLYVFQPLQTSITITATARVAGAAGNVAANTISSIVAGFVGITSVNNPVAAVNGRDAETDTAVRQRFPIYLQSLKTANLASVQSKIAGIGANVTYQIIEYQHFNGNPFVAGFTVVVDDGSGAAPASFVSAVSAAVTSTRAAGIQFEVSPPTNVTANVSLTVNAVTGTALALVQQNVINAIIAYINTLGVGVPVNFVNLSNVIGNVTGVFSYSNVTINGAASNLAIALTQLARAGTITFV